MPDKTVILDYRCKRCGTSFTKTHDEATFAIQQTNNVFSLLLRFQKAIHHCDDKGQGLGELVGFHWE